MSETITLLNIGTGTRIITNTKNRQVVINVGEQKTVEVPEKIAQKFRRLAAKETLRIVDETIIIDAIMRRTISVLREFDSLPEDVIMREANAILGANAFSVREPRHKIRSLLVAHLQSIAPELPSVGEVLKNDPPAPRPEPENSKGAPSKLGEKKATEIPAFLTGTKSIEKGPKPKIKVR